MLKTEESIDRVLGELIGVDSWALTNYLYEVPINVEPGRQCDMPNNMIGAYVSCYAGAKNANQALQKCVDALRDKGYIFKDVFEQAVELDPAKWENFLDKTWPEIIDSFPTQKEVNESVADGNVFFGPFIGYS